MFLTDVREKPSHPPLPPCPPSLFLKISETSSDEGLKKEEERYSNSGYVVKVKLTGWMWELREREVKDDCQVFGLST